MREWQRLARELRHHAPIKAWARRAAVNRVTLQRMLIGDSAYIHGEAFKRLVSLLDSLERNEWRWIVVGPRNKSESYHWEGYAPHEHRPGFKVDFTTTTISLT